MVFILVFIIAGAALKSSMPNLLGRRGEAIVASRLRELDANLYKVINNLIVPTERGTSQIDHVVVSPYGIFVLETKHFDGFIYGNERDQRWTQVIYKRKSRFMNPIIQNKGHIKALRGVLTPFEPLKLVSMVVFSGRGTLKTNATTEIIYPSEIKKVIAEHIVQEIPPQGVEQIYSRLLDFRVTDKKVEADHVTRTRQRLASAKESVSRGACPRCGGTLVRRNGKYGPFMGCSNYPKCRFLSKLN